MQNAETGELTTSENLKVHPRMKELYKFLKYNGRVIDIENYDPEIGHIFSREVLRMINDGEDGWQAMLPEGIPELIEEGNFFGCNLHHTQEVDSEL